MKRYFLLTVLFLIVHTGYGQLSVFSGIGVYASSMSDLKRFQNELLQQYVAGGIQAKITDEFPAFAGFRFGVKYPVDAYLYLGAFGEFTSTGGRIHYQDYSGELVNELLTTYYAFGGMIGDKLIISDNFFIDAHASLLLIASDLEIKSVLRINNQTESTIYGFGSFSLGAEPTIMPSYTYHSVTVSIYASYLFYPPSELEYDSHADAYLIHENKERVTINWSGIRYGMVVGFEF